MAGSTASIMTLIRSLKLMAATTAKLEAWTVFSGLAAVSVLARGNCPRARVLASPDDAKRPCCQE